MDKPQVEIDASGAPVQFPKPLFTSTEVPIEPAHAAQVHAAWVAQKPPDPGRPSDYLTSPDAKCIVAALDRIEGAIRSKARSIAGEQYVEAFEKRMERRCTEMNAKLESIDTTYIKAWADLSILIGKAQKELAAMRDQLFEHIPASPPFEAASTDGDSFQHRLDDVIASKRKFKIVVEGEPERLVLLPGIGKRRNP